MSRLTQAVRRYLPLRLRRFLLQVGLHAGDWLYLDLLRRWGLQPLLIIDVGAYHGEWSRFAHRIFPQAQVLMIEAQQSKQPRLQSLLTANDRLHLEMALLGPTSGEMVSFVEMETGSSVMPEGWATQGRRVEIQTRTLDSILSQAEWSDRPIDLLKLDVQGYELQVLLGAEEALQRTQFVVLEASLIEINQGCPLIGEVLAYMAARQFVLVDIWSQVRLGSGALWQTDLLFAHARSALRPRPGF